MTGTANTPLTDEDARRLISADGLDQTLFVEAGAGSGKTTQLIARLVRLVDDGVELRNVAAITFTEKAAQELRDRLRATLSKNLDDQPEPSQGRRRTALTQLDSAAVGTLHSFAQRLLGHLPIEAGLPPRIEVLDEVSSMVAFEERWQGFLERMLDDRSLRRTIHLGLSLGITPDRYRDLARVFDGSWDLLQDPARTPWSDAEPPPVDLSGVEAAWTAIQDLVPGCQNEACKLLAHITSRLGPALQALRDQPDDGLRLAAIPDLPVKVGNVGGKKNWPDITAVKDAVGALGQAATDAAAATTQAMVQQVAATVRRFTLEAARQRRHAGELEFHDLLVLARDLLRGPHGDEARRLLHNRYQRILLDEFQDTDPIQIDIAVLLASAPEQSFDGWEAGSPLPGRLFVVGDPKQSIYRFRRADIRLFLQARSSLASGTTSLVTNFRSTPTVLGWVNDTFGELIQHEEGSQPEYVPLVPHRDDLPEGSGPGVTLLGADAHPDKPLAADLRMREAADVAATITTAITEGWRVGTGEGRTARLGDITILLPARTSLPALEDALIEAGIPYRAESASLVYATGEIRALMAALRALADPTDTHSTVTALRSVLFGCGDDDLAEWKLVHRGSFNLRAPLPEAAPADHPVAESLTYLRRLHRQASWTAPPDLLSALVADRGLLETGLVARRPRDVWRRVRFVVDQARAWSDSQHGGLRQYLSWAALQSSDQARVAEAVLPETDDDSVRIMTVHAAKGMEFPIVIMSGLSSRPAGGRGAVQVLWGDTVQLKLGKDVGTEEWDTHKAVDESMGFHERLRLLYVGATRAKDHLVVSLHRDKELGKPSSGSSAQLLASTRGTSSHGTAFVPKAGRLPGSPADRGASLPAREVWEGERAHAVERGRWQRTTSATDAGDSLVLPAAPAVVVEEVQAGAAKAQQDLDLPPWLKGRYGTAVGRAVHGVLQTVDLATGAGLDEAVAAQCVAESITDRAATVRALAQMALDSDIVQEAAAARHWRETYVAVPLVDGRVMEGYVDLLFERPGEGLVIVDYKVASAGTDLSERAVHYGPQMQSYAGSLTISAEDVSETVLLYLTPEGATSMRCLS